MIANEFNKHFSSIIDITNSNNRRDRSQDKLLTNKYLDKHNGDPLVFKPASTQEIFHN